MTRSLGRRHGARLDSQTPASELSRRTAECLRRFQARLLRSGPEAREFPEWLGEVSPTTYRMDERSLERFQGLHYSKDRGIWMARFVAPPGRKSALPHAEATFTEVLAFAKLLNACQVKPSESVRALAAFEAKFDREAAKLLFASVTDFSLSRR